jgi:hypothetical protein
MTDVIRFEFRCSGHLTTGQGRLLRTEPRGPVVLDAETGEEMLIPWACVVRDSTKQVVHVRQKTLFGDA